MTDKNFVIVNVNQNTFKFKEIIKEINDPFIVYLTNKIIIKSFNYVLLDNLIKPRHYQNVKKVKLFKKEWYKPIEEHIKYFDISLGELVEQFSLKLWPIFLKIDILSELIKQKKPENIYLITESKEDVKILNELTKNKGINFKYYLFKKIIKIDTKTKVKNIFYNYISTFQNLLFNIYISKQKRKNNIFFIGNVRQTSPLLIKLKEDRNNIIIRIGENIGKGIFTKYCDYYVTFKNYNDKKINEKLVNIKKELNIKFAKIKQNKKFRDSLFYKVNLYNIIEDYIESLFLDYFIKLIKYMEIIKKLNSKIDIVVTHNDIIPFEKTIVKTSNNFGIPTLTMLEGFLSEKRIKNEKDYSLFLPFSSRKMAVYSENQKNAIINNYKLPKNNILVTGYPLFDVYYNTKPVTKKEIYYRYRIPQSKKILLYTAERYSKDISERPIGGSFTQKQIEKVYYELFKTIKEISGLFLIIKNHPSGSLDKEVIDNIAREFNFSNYVITKDMDIYNLINASYAIITRQSTIGIETILIKKPLIVMDTYFDTNDTMGYTEFGASLHVRNPNELKNVLDILLVNDSLRNKLDKNMKKFVKHHYSLNDGNSSLRMSKAIKEMINDRHFK